MVVILSDAGVWVVLPKTYYYLSLYVNCSYASASASASSSAWDNIGFPWITYDYVIKVIKNVDSDYNGEYNPYRNRRNHSVNTKENTMYGKHFACMYEGSMYGAGAVTFAVMGYVISHQVPDRTHGSVVSLNAKMLAGCLGEEVESVERAVNFLCSPDQESKTKTDDGRRLVKIGQFEYKVVNGAKYRAIRDEETRREQVREAVRRHRNSKEKKQDAPYGTGPAPAIAPF